MKRYKNNEEVYASIQRINQEMKYDLPTDIAVDPERKAEVIDLPLNEEVYMEIQDNCCKQGLMGIRKSMDTEKNKINTINNALNRYSDEKVTAQTLRGLTDWLCENFDFLYVEGGALYIYHENYFQLFFYAFAARFLTQVFREYGITYPLRSADCKEIVQMLQAQPQIVRRMDECRTNQECILFDDCTFDVPTQAIRAPRMEDYQFSKINFPLSWETECSANAGAREFVERFCSYDSALEDYLWELIGYLLSGYQQKKIVCFLGPSNSGKSTLANMIRRICGTEACVAMGIKELSGSFNLAELQGKRLCIDSEMDATTLNSKDISLLKKVVGNDLMQGNKKYEQQFYFQCQTKFLICTNNKIRFKSNEDTVSFFNRFRFFELQESIPAEEQCYDMDKILDENRTYFLQKSMEGLCRLVSNNFVFSYDEPAENFVENASQKADTKSVQDFVTVSCEFHDEFKETMTDLYEAYKQFTFDNGQEPVSSKAFSRFLVDSYEVCRVRTSKHRFFQGIKLVSGDR